MTAQELKEELLQREAYAQGYAQASRDIILSITQKLSKEVNNGNSPNTNNGNTTKETN